MKHKFISKRYWKDIATPMGKVDELSNQFEDVINLSLGDPDLVTHDLIIENAFIDAKNGHTKYTEFRGDPEFRNEITNYYKEEYDLEIEDRNIMVTASGCIAMYLALEAILDDEDEVIIHAPFFTPYPQQIRLVRGIPVVLDTYEEEGFQINVERMEKLITERTKAIIINTPNNPSGACFGRLTLEKIASFAQKHDLIVIADDIYGAFSFCEKFTPIMSIEGMKERTITINSFSKDFTMTGWRVGNIIAPSYIVETIQKINENLVFTAPSISQRGALHALRNRKNIQPGMVAEYKKRVEYAIKRINSIDKMSVMPIQGTFYLFVNIKKTGFSSIEVSDKILREAHVLTIPGIAFGNCGEGYIRIACTVNIDKIKEAFDRIERMEMFIKS